MYTYYTIMNASLCFALFSLFALSSSFPTILDKFELWAAKFHIKFNNDEQYFATYEKWVSNDKFIEQHNFKNATFTLAHNQFSGMNSEDFSKYFGLSNYQTLRTQTENLRGSTRVVFHAKLQYPDLPSEVDWVSQNAVTPVKDQGQCGSCWSFSTTGSLEGIYSLTNNELVSFSEQQLVDCDNYKNGGKDLGCNGGLMDNAFNWINKNGGLCSENDYPYVSGTTLTKGNCETNCAILANSKIVSYTDVTPSSDVDMMAAVSQQPVSVAIEADQREFQLYSSGVFSSDSCGTNLDHGVLVVGYGTLDGEDYYKVKNSWGTSWGLSGYILLGRGSQYNGGDGQCGVLLQASFPVL